MNRPDDNFDLEKSMNNFKNSQSEPDFNGNENLSANNVKAREQRLKKFYFKLITFGLIGGVCLSIVAAVLLEKSGLTNRFNDRSPEIQPEPQKRLPETKI